MTPKQERFVQEYLIDLNATQAAIRSGYSEKTAAKIGSENLIKPEIQESIQKAREKLAKKAEISQEYVLNSLKTVADRCMESVPVFDMEGNEIGKFTFNANGANRSLELLGKHLGMFTEKVDMNLNVKGDLLGLIDLTDDELDKRIERIAARKAD